MPENDLWNKSDDEPRIHASPIVTDAELGLEEEPPELEATELELAWYRAVARSMRFYGRQWFLALSGLGLGFAGIFCLPTADERGILEWPHDSFVVIVLGMLPAISFGLLGFWAYRSGSFPMQVPKRVFSGEYDVTVTRSGYRQWIGFNVLLIPKSVQRILHRGQAYTGEGFIISKWDDNWLVPVKIGEWTVSAHDRPEPLSRPAGWLVFSLFQMSWIAAFGSHMGPMKSPLLVHKIYFYLFLISCLAYLLVNLSLLGILLFRAFIKKHPEGPDKN
jgi:hypothetical protein